MVFGWRQEFSCGFRVAWAGSGRKPSLANMLPPRGPGWGGAMHGGVVRQGGGATPQGATAMGTATGATGATGPARPDR
ncbi:hypothetical protein [Corynebacterium matruchotii]|uniref:hypothetical protein n=1 Tax=Corynebacterium matruchotii TaxID=43768 RepID=UPI00288AB1A5|nr:hypothetical protein [Corynebacterium matruchotii]